LASEILVPLVIGEIHVEGLVFLDNPVSIVVVLNHGGIWLSSFFGNLTVLSLMGFLLCDILMVVFDNRMKSELATMIG